MVRFWQRSKEVQIELAETSDNTVCAADENVIIAYRHAIGTCSLKIQHRRPFIKHNHVKYRIFKLFISH